MKWHCVMILSLNIKFNIEDVFTCMLYKLCDWGCG